MTCVDGYVGSGTAECLATVAADGTRFKAFLWHFCGLAVVEFQIHYVLPLNDTCSNNVARDFYLFNFFFVFFFFGGVEGGGEKQHKRKLKVNGLGEGTQTGFLDGL